MKKIFAVILSFNTHSQTHDLLASLNKVKKKTFELSVVIVDNGSYEKFTLIPSEEKEKVHVIRIEENTGFTGGNNIGIRYALKNGAEYLLIINNDTFVDSKCVEELIQKLDAEESIGMTVPKIYFTKGHEFHKERYAKNELGKVFWYAGGSMDWENIIGIHRGVDEVDYGQYDREEAVTLATGCCMLIKREVLEKVGIFDEKFFLYYEDADLSQRILKAGYTMLYVSSAVLWHSNAGSTGGSGSSLQDYFISRNRMLFGMRYGHVRTKIALVRESLRLLISGRPMQKKGIRDFYLGRFGKGTYFDK